MTFFKKTAAAGLALTLFTGTGYSMGFMEGFESFISKATKKIEAGIEGSVASATSGIEISLENGVNHAVRNIEIIVEPLIGQGMVDPAVLATVKSIAISCSDSPRQARRPSVSLLLERFLESNCPSPTSDGISRRSSFSISDNGDEPKGGCSSSASVVSFHPDDSDTDSTISGTSSSASEVSFHPDDSDTDSTISRTSSSASEVSFHPDDSDTDSTISRTSSSASEVSFHSCDSDDEAEECEKAPNGPVVTHPVNCGHSTDSKHWFYNSWFWSFISSCFSCCGHNVDCED